MIETETATENLRIRTTPEFKAQLETLSHNYGLSMSELVRKSVLEYVDNYTREIVWKIYKRSFDALSEGSPNKTPFDLLEDITTALERTPIRALEAYADPDIIDDESLRKVLLAKLHVGMMKKMKGK